MAHRLPAHPRRQLRPFVLPCGSRAGCSETGTGQARHQHHGHQRQDLRRGGRAASAAAGRGRDAVVSSKTPIVSVSDGPMSSRRRSRRSRDQVAMIEELVERDFAYESDGDVYFRVGRFPEYGRLSGQRLDEVQEQEPNPRKEDPRDFALWKANKPGEDTWWESPWGRGRPGWHIECSAMSEKHLGPEFEIHGGGLDLVFPHHENERRPVRGARPRLRPDLDAQRDAPVRRRRRCTSRWATTSR